MQLYNSYNPQTAIEMKRHQFQISDLVLLSLCAFIDFFGSHIKIWLISGPKHYPQAR